MGVLAAGFAAAAWGRQAPSVKREVVEKHDLGASGPEGIMAAVEISAGAREGRHIHPGADLFAYVMAGTVTLDVESRLSATSRAGDHFFIPAGKVHEGRLPEKRRDVERVPAHGDDPGVAAHP